MLSIKRKKNGDKAIASGFRTRANSIYKPYQKEDFKISRGKFEEFVNDPRYFYMDRVLGIKRPSMPGWSLNSLTDKLLKKEFDECREKQVPHRLMEENGLSHLVPYKHEMMDKWRDSLHHGLQLKYKDTNILLTGGVDDIWQDTRDQSLVIVDYKSQASKTPASAEEYFSSPYRESYKTQLDFYNYLMQETGMKVSKQGYFVIVNAVQKDGFHGCLNFDEVVIPYTCNTDWIPEKIDEMIEVLNSYEMPMESPFSENSAYENAIAKLIHNGKIEELEEINSALIEDSYVDTHINNDLMDDFEKMKEETLELAMENIKLKDQIKRIGPKLVEKKLNENSNVKREQPKGNFEEFFGGDNVK